MSKLNAIGVLLAAAVLEAGGDAFMRAGLHSAGRAARLRFFVVAAVTLFSYGWLVNAPGWDFGRLLGLYVVFFFVMAQLVSWIAFHQPPSNAVLVGGVLIVAGGLVVTLGA
jgi:hypothetical protein